MSTYTEADDGLRRNLSIHRYGSKRSNSFERLSLSEDHSNTTISISTSSTSLYTPPSPGSSFSSSTSTFLPNLSEDDPIIQEETHIIPINLYDLNPTDHVVKVKIDSKSVAKDLCNSLWNKFCQNIWRTKNFMNGMNEKNYYLLFTLNVFDNTHNKHVKYIKTIGENDVIIKSYERIIDKIRQKYPRTDMATLRNSVIWYYKNINSPPIQFAQDEEMIGEDSDDEFEEITSSNSSMPSRSRTNSAEFSNLTNQQTVISNPKINSVVLSLSSRLSKHKTIFSNSEISYLATSNMKGNFLRRSLRDLSLWKKELCIFSDSLFFVDLNTNKGITVKLNGNITIIEPFSHENGRPAQYPIMDIEKFGYPKSIVHFSILSGSFIHIFRSNSVEEQNKWISNLIKKSRNIVENEYFYMSEVIISDEETRKNNVLIEEMNKLLDIQYCFNEVKQSFNFMTEKNIKNDDNILPVTPIIPLKSLEFDPNTLIINPTTRIVRSPLLHTLECRRSLLTQGWKIILEVNKFKELFRHDLYVTKEAQYNMANKIYHIFLASYVKFMDNKIQYPVKGDIDIILAKSFSLTTINKIKEKLNIHLQNYTLFLEKLEKEKQIENEKRLKEENERKLIKESQVETSASTSSFWSWMGFQSATPAQQNNSISPPIPPVRETSKSEGIHSRRGSFCCDLAAEDVYINATLFDDLVQEIFQILNLI